jgi:hypothetical protein
VGGGPRGLTIADADGDGALDIATANFDDDRVSLLYNDGAGGFFRVQSLLAGIEPYAVALVDVTADDVPEMIVVRRGNAELAIYGRQGNQTYTLEGVYLLPLNPVAMDVGHLDDDGVPDIVVAAAGANVVSVLMSFP